MRCSLAQTGQWVRNLGRIDGDRRAAIPGFDDVRDRLEESARASAADRRAPFGRHVGDADALGAAVGAARHRSCGVVCNVSDGSRNDRTSAHQACAMEGGDKRSAGAGLSPRSLGAGRESVTCRRLRAMVIADMALGRTKLAARWQQHRARAGSDRTRISVDHTDMPSNDFNALFGEAIASYSWEATRAGRKRGRRADAGEPGGRERAPGAIGIGQVARRAARGTGGRRTANQRATPAPARGATGARRQRQLGTAASRRQTPAEQARTGGRMDEAIAVIRR